MAKKATAMTVTPMSGATFTAPDGKRFTIKRNGVQVAVIENGKSVELELEAAFVNTFEVLAEDVEAVKRD